MSWKDVRRAADEAAAERHINPEKRELFIRGAEWAVNKLWDCIKEDHYDDMMGKSAKEYVDRLRAGDFREVLSQFIADLKPKTAEPGASVDRDESCTPGSVK